jgi:cobalt-zinc-cadmium efflux system membrane fusion protein
MTHHHPPPVRASALVLLIACLTACSGRSDTDVAAPAAVAVSPTPAIAPPQADPMRISVDATLSQRLSVEDVATRSVAETIRIPGRFEVNDYRTSRIGAPITGRVTGIDVMVGQQVNQGQVLAELSSPELAQAQLAFLRAHAQVNLLTRAVERAQLLLAADVIGAAELQRRQSEMQIAQAEKRAASDQLLALGLSRSRLQTLETTGEIQSKTAVSAPLSGTVIERKAATGQMVSPSDVLFLVSDLRQLWATAEVPEQDAQFVQAGQQVLVEVPALGNAKIAGKVAVVADVVDPATRTVRVLVDVDNRERRLKPSMLITMLIEGRVASVQVIPESAVVRDNDLDHVFLQVAVDTFRLTQVDLGLSREGKRTLLRPLPDGARIVADGAFHLNNVRMQRLSEGR